MAAAASSSAPAPAPAQANLWSEILDSVSGRKSSAKKNLIILGEPNTGKSTLLSHVLKTSSTAGASGPGGNSSLGRPTSLPGTVKSAASSRLDMAMGYEWVDVRDEGDEETLPPLSIYTPSSSHSSLLDLLPLSLSAAAASSPSALSSSTPPASSSSAPNDITLNSSSTLLPPPSSLLQDTAVLIVLDWTRPAEMISELLTWLEWVESWSGTVAGRTEGEEARERLQYYLQHYVEPAAPIPIASSSLNPSSSSNPNDPSASTVLPEPSESTYNSIINISEVLPLGPGTLTRNPNGVPITIVCTKADQIDVVAEELGFGGGPAGSGAKGVGGKGGWEERTDWINQVLRLVALMYGASLFYTSQSHPSTFIHLRSYLFHRIFSSSPSPNTTTTSSSDPSSDLPIPISLSLPSSQPSSSRFPFPHRANVLDRDQVLVPAGWDSWGKINVLREGFEPERVTDAWDVSLLRRRKEKGKGREQSRNGGEENVDEDQEDVEDLWAGVVPDLRDDHLTSSTAPQHQNSTTRPKTNTEPDNSFLSKHYDLIQSDPTRDPRQSFRASAQSSTSGGGSGVGGGLTNGAGGGGRLGGEERMAGIVGPLGSGGLSLPGVERAMKEMEGTSSPSASRPTLLSNREYSSSNVPLSSSSSALVDPSAPAVGGVGVASPLQSPSIGANGQPVASTEALHNFFASLLKQKSTSGVTGLAPASSSPSSSTTAPPPPPLSTASVPRLPPSSSSSDAA